MLFTRRTLFQKLLPRTFESSKNTNISEPNIQFRNTLSTTPFIGEIMMCPYSFVPQNFLACNGQLVSISQYQTLFSVIGTTYGGDGVTTFGLPNLNGRAPLGTGAGTALTAHSLGETGGAKTNILTAANIPLQSKNFDEVIVRSQGLPIGTGIVKGSNASAFNAQIGGSATPIDNMPPYLLLNFVISTQGTFPSP